MSMPFPSGTWNFEVVSTRAHTPANSLAADWGTAAFQTTNVGQTQMQLTVGAVQSPWTNVVWTSNSDNEGSIGPTVFTVGSNQYSFQRITITNLTILGVNFSVAHVADADVTSSGNGHNVFFTGLPIGSNLLSPKVAVYTDTSQPSLFTITVNADGSVTVTPAAGWTLGNVSWNPPPQNWPPSIGWTQQNSSINQTNVYTGTVTAKFDRGAQQVVYQFGGALQTSATGDGNDGDWTSTSNSVPIPATAARYA